MLEIILNKIAIMLFFMAGLTTLRHIYYFLQAYFMSTEEQPVKYRLTNSSLFYLGISMSYILMGIFTGIKL